MALKRTLLHAAAGVALGAGAAMAEPGLIIDLGGRSDASFNESAYKGAERWVEETGGEYIETELKEEAQREQTMRRMAERGADPVVVLGFANASTLDKIAPDYPEVTFVIIDEEVDQPNVKSIKFAEHEGSYLAGVAAAMASESGIVSFIGGMDVPLIRKFACGYAQGATATDPGITVLQDMIGFTPDAWDDVPTAIEKTRTQAGRGADVIYAAAGGSGIGVLQGAADEGIYAIGVDSNQNALQPGTVLTSMVKRVGDAVFDAFEAAKTGSIETGLEIEDLASGGVGLAVDEHNAEILTEEMQGAVEDAKQKIISGEIEVHDYTSDGNCPV